MGASVKEEESNDLKCLGVPGGVERKLPSGLSIPENRDAWTQCYFLLSADLPLTYPWITCLQIALSTLNHLTPNSELLVNPLLNPAG